MYVMTGKVVKGIRLKNSQVESDGAALSATYEVLGADKLVLLDIAASYTVGVNNPQLIADAAETLRSQCAVAAIDAKLVRALPDPDTRAPRIRRAQRLERFERERSF